MNTPDDRIVISTILCVPDFHSTKVSFGIWIMRRTLSYPLTANIKHRLNFDIHIEYIASPRLTGKTFDHIRPDVGHRKLYGIGV